MTWMVSGEKGLQLCQLGHECRLPGQIGFWFDGLRMSIRYPIVRQPYRQVLPLAMTALASVHPPR